MRDLSKIFNPKTIAVVGASPKENSVGLGLAKNALLGQQDREVFFVNINQPEVLGVKTFKSILEIQKEIDLVVIAVPAVAVKEVVKECCEKKVGSIIIISAGFSEIGKEGEIIQKEIIKLVKDANISLVGPNCLGIIRNQNNLNASFAPELLKQGNVAFVSQSGAILDAIIDGAGNLGLSYAISFGNEADVDLNDFLEWLEKDDATKVIALYVEAIKDGKRFMEIARRIVKTKPILVLKAGKFDTGKNAIKSHTGSMAGDYKVYNAVFKQIGVIEVDSIEELSDIAKLVSCQKKCENSFAIVTNGGGCGVLSADYCKQNGINLVKLSKETIDKISESEVMNKAWSKANPVDIVGDASCERYKVAIEAVLNQNNVSGLIVIQTPQIMTNALENAKVIVEAKKRFPNKPIICFFLGEKMSEQAIKFLEENNILNYSELKRGINAIKYLIK